MPGAEGGNRAALPPTAHFDARPDDPVGRGPELRRIDHACRAVTEAPQALLLEGPPGIGKTAVWRAGVERASARGLRVLVARPAEVESSLAFAALGDLLGGAVDEIGRLPQPQRRALRVALLLEEPERPTVDVRSVYVAVLGLLRELSSDGPLLIAVDDVQWLDSPTGGALAFALRRLVSAPVLFLGAARPSAAEFGFERLERVEIGPLDLESLGRIVRRALDTQLPRPVLRRVETISGGNPFYALELARALVRRGESQLHVDSLPLPETLADAVRERIATLPEEARDALLVTAALSAPTRSIVAAAVGGVGALERARETGVVVFEADRVRLQHPLLGSVASAMQPAEARHKLHRRLAAMVTSDEERARHLANAAEGPDEAVAAALETAARRGRARGASDSAATFAELAVELTPPDDADAAMRRQALAGDCHFAAGDAHRAELLLEEVVAGLSPGAARARVLWRLAAVKASVAGPPAAYPLYARALEESRDDARLAAQILDRLTTWRWIGEGAAAAAPHAQELVDLAEEVNEPALLARAIGALLALEVVQGRPLDRARYERMLELERLAPDAGPDLPGSTLHHQLLTWAGDYDESHRRVTNFLERARERGDASQLLPLWCLAYIDILTGNWQGALAAASHGLELIEQVGRGALVPGFVSLRALAHVHLGDVERARADVQLTVAHGTKSGQEIHVLHAQAALASLELSRGNSRAALDAFALVAQGFARRRERGLGEWWLVDELEARVAEGDIDGAARRLAPYRRDAIRAGLPRFEAACARAAGVIAFARGDEDGAIAEFDLALAHHERFADDYQLARTLLALGTVQRRLRRRAAAAETLGRAASLFDSGGASLWLERARREHGRIGGRAAATPGLTPTEREIAELVRTGRSNAEVARALSISPRTVEWNLSKIYRKLRVSSRTELAARLLDTT